MTSLVRAGDLDGLGSVYSPSGSAVLREGERLLLRREGCDLAAIDVGRRFRSKPVFLTLAGPLTGTLYVTDRRLIFVREIDPWREVKPLMTPLGMPTGIAKSLELKEAKSRGGRRYCEISISRFRLSRARRRKGSTALQLSGDDGSRLNLYLYAEPEDPNFFAFVEHRFGQGPE